MGVGGGWVKEEEVRVVVHCNEYSAMRASISNYGRVRRVKKSITFSVFQAVF